MADTACLCLEARFAHLVGEKGSENTTLKISLARITATSRGTAGFHTTKIYAEILVGDFAAKHEKIILARERLGPEDHIVFLDMVGHVLEASIKVGD